MADVKKEPATTPAKTYGDVLITLENCVIPQEKLAPTPSVRDGLDSETEMNLRVLGCEFIQTAGILLRLPQVAMATGQVLFQRFYYSKSFVKHNMEIVAMACINLASKIEEAPRRIRDVINVFHHIRQKRNNRTIEPMVLDQKYLNMKNQVIKAERRVLKELGFCVHVKHPHKMIVTYLQVLECERNSQLVQTAWNYMNDSLRTDVFVRFMPETIACACIFLSARQLNVVLPNNPPWYGLLGTDEAEVKEIALMILRLYARPKKTYEELDRVVERCRLAMQEAKFAKLKGQSEVNNAAGTPNNFSPHSSRQASPKVSADSPGLPNSYNPHRLKEEPASGGSGQSSHKERNGKVARRSKTRTSNSRSHSKSPRRGGHGRSRSHSSRSRSSSGSRSPSRSPHNDKHYGSHAGGKHHKKKDEHKRSRRDRDRERDRDHDREHDRKYAKAKSRSRKRKHSRSSSRDNSRSRSRSRSPIRRDKYDYKDSPGRNSGSKSKQRRQRSHSRERSRKGGKRDSGGHSRSRDRRRR
ncbi:cyclin-L1-like [Acanthaster planci]|uniref:Cyclin-L1-like n=1 Tax=Acanthaster planci TaxID=133434 RepID=A0A8B8A2Z5_ACAPL|nr:cyclin-L1-like [Acanthaster planci]